MPVVSVYAHIAITNLTKVDPFPLKMKMPIDRFTSKTNTLKCATLQLYCTDYLKQRRKIR